MFSYHRTQSGIDCNAVIELVQIGSEGKSFGAVRSSRASEYGGSWVCWGLVFASVWEQVKKGVDTGKIGAIISDA